MKEHGFIFSEVGERRLHDGLGTRQTGLSVSDDSMALGSVGIEPLVHQAKVLAAVVYLDVVQPCELRGVHGHDVLGPSVSHLCKILGEVDGGIRIVANAEQEDLPTELVDAPNWAIQAVRDLQGVSRSDLRGSGADRCKRVRTVTSKHAWQAPERLRDDTHAETRSCTGVEGMIVVIAHARHDQGTLGPYRPSQRMDQTLGPTFNWRQLRKGGVHHKDSPRLDTEREELRSDLVRFKRVHHLESTRAKLA
jgi:hypothetical protein